MRGEEEHNEVVPLSILAALPFHHLLRERERERDRGGKRRVKEMRQPNRGEDRWRGAAGSDFVN